MNTAYTQRITSVICVSGLAAFSMCIITCAPTSETTGDLITPMAPMARADVDEPDMVEQVKIALDYERAQRKATIILLALATNDDPFIRANVIEAMQHNPPRSLPLTQKGLTDSSNVVRFASLVTAGILGFDSLMPIAHELLGDDDPSVRAAAIYALYANGKNIDITPMADLLAYPDPNVRANVAMLIGMMGDFSAIDVLKWVALQHIPKIADDRMAIVRIQIAEVIVQLGDVSMLPALRAGVHSNSGEVRVLSINGIGAVGDEKGAMVLQTMLDNEPVEVRLASAGALGRIINQSKADDRNETDVSVGNWLRRLEPRAREAALCEAGNINPAVRAQAAWSLGWFDKQTCYDALLRMLDDESLSVRVAASEAVLRYLSRNKVEAGGGVGG